MFIQKQILFMLALLSEEPISASVKTANLFCSQGLYHLAPLTHWGGLGGPQTPRLVGSSTPQCHLLSLILQLLEIFFTRLKTQILSILSPDRLNFKSRARANDK